MEERRKKVKNKTKDKQICYNCKKEGHFKRNCPEIKCFYCNGNHLKKHCIKYYLNQRYKKWVSKKEKYIKAKEDQKETKKEQKFKQDAKTNENKEVQTNLKKEETSTTEKDKNVKVKELKQNPQQKKQSSPVIKIQKETEITKPKSKTNPEEKRKKWLLNNPSNSKKNIPWNKEYKEKEKKKIELQAKLQAQSQDKEIQDLEKKIEARELIHKNRLVFLENMNNKYKNIENVTAFEEANTIVDILYKDQKISLYIRTILLINQLFEVAEEKKLQHRNIYYDIKELKRYIIDGNGKDEGPLSKQALMAIPEQTKAKWRERLNKLKEW